MAKSKKSAVKKPAPIKEGTKFQLYYWCSNNGDGSVSVHPNSDEALAEKLDEAQDEGWGESSAGQIDLQIKNGQLCYRETEWNGKKIIDKWLPIKVVE